MCILQPEPRVIYPPEGYEPTMARWVWALEDTRRRTKRGLDGLTGAVLDWVAPEGGNSIGTLLYHLVVIELSYLYEDILGIGWSAELEPLIPYDVRDEEGRLALIQGESLAQHLQRLDDSRALLFKALGRITLEELRRPRRVEDYEVTPEWTLHHLMQHEAEHRGQIGEIRERAERASGCA